MGSDINFFVTKDLKRYTPSSDQTIFGPIRRLPTHILSLLGLETADVPDHIEATEGIIPYPSTPPLPSSTILPEGTATPSTTTLSNLSQRRKSIASKRKATTPKKKLQNKPHPLRNAKPKPPLY